LLCEDRRGRRDVVTSGQKRKERCCYVRTKEEGEMMLCEDGVEEKEVMLCEEVKGRRDVFM